MAKKKEKDPVQKYYEERPPYLPSIDAVINAAMPPYEEEEVYSEEAATLTTRRDYHHAAINGARTIYDGQDFRFVEGVKGFTRTLFLFDWVQDTVYRVSKDFAFEVLCQAAAGVHKATIEEFIVNVLEGDSLL